MTVHGDLGAQPGGGISRGPGDGTGSRREAHGAAAEAHSDDGRRDPARRLSPHEAPTDILFRDLVMTGPARPRGGRLSWGVSVASHVLIVGAVILVPILWPEALPQPDYVRALLYNPPPPPPPPLPKGTALLERKEIPKPTTPDPQPRKTEPKIESPVIVEASPTPETRVAESEQFGSPLGSDIGVPEGMDVGVEGGVVGGVPGGVIGGVLGGTGDIPVTDYDQPPRLLTKTAPVYPQEGFVKKIEGTVELEILIDVTGRVSRARVVRSIPILDSAALACVRQWVFAPAIKHGRPVPTLASAPVRFTIF